MDQVKEIKVYYSAGKWTYPLMGEVVDLQLSSGCESREYLLTLSTPPANSRITTLKKMAACCEMKAVKQIWQRMRSTP